MCRNHANHNLHKQNDRLTTSFAHSEETLGRSSIWAHNFWDNFCSHDLTFGQTFAVNLSSLPEWQWKQRRLERWVLFQVNVVVRLGWDLTTRHWQNYQSNNHGINIEEKKNMENCGFLPLWSWSLQGKKTSCKSMNLKNEWLNSCWSLLLCLFLHLILHHSLIVTGHSQADHSNS